MDLAKQFAMDTAKETDGVWFDLDEKSRICVARMNNHKHRAALEMAVKPFRVQINAGTLPDNKYKEITLGPLADFVLVGWENLALEGELLEYSAENARRVLSEFPEFRALVTSLSLDAENYRASDLEEDVKNS